jgi:hypothetical protein
MILNKKSVNKSFIFHFFNSMALNYFCQRSFSQGRMGRIPLGSGEVFVVGLGGQADWLEP